jgi:hypothetical protein
VDVWSLAFTDRLKQGALFLTLTYSRPGRRTARETADVVTPSRRAASATERPRRVISSLAMMMARGAGMGPRRLPAASSFGVIPARAQAA